MYMCTGRPLICLCKVTKYMYACIISHRDKANPSNDAQRQLFFFKRKRRAASGGTRTRSVLRSRQTLYQLSHRGMYICWLLLSNKNFKGPYLKPEVIEELVGWLLHDLNYAFTHAAHAFQVGSCNYCGKQDHVHVTTVQCTYTCTWKVHIHTLYVLFNTFVGTENVPREPVVL